MINEDKLRESVNEFVARHTMATQEIFVLDEVMNISKKHNANVMGLINALINKASENIDGNINSNEDNVNMLIKLIESVSENSKIHPIDATFVVLNMASDILIQLSIADDMEGEE